jgi:hypothetical protein
LSLTAIGDLAIRPPSGRTHPDENLRATARALARCEDHRVLLRAGFCGKPALPALLGRGVNLAGPSGYWVGHSSGSFAVGLLSVREPSLCARLPRIHSRRTRCDGRKGEGDYQGATSHAADRSSSTTTSRSALRDVAPWALFGEW